MSDRSAKIIIVCEDIQQQVFARRVLTQLGVPKRDLRIENAPRGMSDAKQWIREKGLPNEWAWFHRYCRKNSKNRRVLLVVSDADNKTVEQHARDLVDGCEPVPSIAEHVCLVAPKWSIETWFKFLRGEPYDETSRTTGADKHRHAKDCFRKADELARICQAQTLPPNTPDSLRKACRVFAQVKSQLK